MPESVFAIAGQAFAPVLPGFFEGLESLRSFDPAKGLGGNGELEAVVAGVSPEEHLPCDGVHHGGKGYVWAIEQRCADRGGPVCGKVFDQGGGVYKG